MECHYTREFDKRMDVNYGKPWLDYHKMFNFNQTGRVQPRQKHYIHFSDYSPAIRKVISDLAIAKKVLGEDKRLDSKSKYRYNKIFGETLDSILRACPDKSKQNLKRSSKMSPIFGSECVDVYQVKM
ncbi:hypothetical protein CEXT_504941 [Caerostris extrusa]|uniref:Uncharacterized protein n=1 Tax=Caerostris extrusa TaxID=172846 RepID=A0AAV4PGM1_CAEEX|nr:hypothetical protein CEXT_504941 [Caerostris extrusa]